MLIHFNFLDNSCNKYLSWEVVKCRAVKRDIYEKRGFFPLLSLHINQSRRSGILIKGTDTLGFALIDINIVS